MPNCFQLISKSTGLATKFVEIDRDICQHLNVPCDPVHWYMGWYDTIGWLIAVTGLSLGTPEIRARVTNMPQESETLLKVLDYLEEHYTSDAWVTGSNSRC